MIQTRSLYLTPSGSRSPSSRLSSAVSDAVPRAGVSARTRSQHNGKVSDLKRANGYAWEDEYQRSWDIVKDDELGSGSFEAMVQSIIENRKKKIMKNPSTPFQRGIIRTLVIIVDGTLAMAERLAPNATITNTKLFTGVCCGIL